MMNNENTAIILASINSNILRFMIQRNPNTP